MAYSINDKYLEALKTFDLPVTISQWAEKVASMYPDLLAAADKQAAGQKNKTTGLREIAARISSRTSKDGFNGRVEEDRSERPRKVRYLSEQDAKLNNANIIEEDIEPINRDEKVRSQYESLSLEDKYRIDELENIVKQLNDYFGKIFEFEHAKALLNNEDPGNHHPDNIQILARIHNRSKNNSNWDRFSVVEQIDYIKSVVNIQKIISKRMGLEINDKILDKILAKISEVY